LGWLLSRTAPKIPLLIIAGFQIASILWVLVVPGYWFLVAFGLMGAAELYGAYYVYYVVCSSAKADVRSNVACLLFISTIVSVAPVLYGWISDVWSLRASFWVALAITLFTTVLVSTRLPSRPQPAADV
jgi:hypothetical protein